VTLVLDNADVARALDVGECLTACRDAYGALAAGGAVNRPTTQTYLPHSLSRSTYGLKSVEGGVRAFGVMALRIASDILREEETSGTLRLNKLPLANGRFVGLVQLFSIETGELLAIMPDGLIQQARVALTSALALEPLAREDAARLALIGTGDQARSHFRIFTAVRRWTEVRVFSPNAEHRAAFVDAMAGCGVPLRAASSVEESIEGADVICTATNASRPIVSARHLAPGVHYNAIREFEVDESVFGASDVVAIHTRFGGSHHYLPPGCEHLPGVRREKARDWSRYPEIGDLLAGHGPGRSSARQVTFFLNNIGTGVQFAAVGYAVWRGARRLGLGRELPGEWFSQDLKP
jgi:ornithine cyclodeaminase/alanine dehydrogenase-like protein (mu-crystallin family)